MQITRNAPKSIPSIAEQPPIPPEHYMKPVQARISAGQSQVVDTFSRGLRDSQ
jgi:hypothetical protein